MRVPFASVVFLISTSTWAAAPVVTLSNDEAVNVKGKVSYLQDKDHLLSIEQAQRAVFTELSPELVPSFGFNRATHWFKIHINNPTQDANWFLEVAYPPLDEVTVFVKDSLGRWRSKKSGDIFPISSREIPHTHLIFPLRIFAGDTDIYLRLTTTSSVQLPLIFWPPVKFYQETYRIQFTHGIFYGILLIMVFYNLFLYISIRDQSTLYYILTLLTGANVVAFFQGYGFFYIYPEWPALNHFFTVFSGPLFIVTSGLLTRSFLQLRHFSEKLDRLLIANMVATTLLVILLLIIPTVISYKTLHLLTILNSCLILTCAFYCFLKKYRPARYFLLAWVTLLLAAVLFSLKNLGYFPSNELSNSALYIGGIMQTLLISFALGDRINFLTKENQEVKEKELALKQRLNEQLEAEIKLRTEEIHHANKELQETNQIKDKLFSVISHDLKGPLNSLKGTLNVLRLGALKPGEFETLTETIETQLHQTSYLLDNLLQWAKTQMQGEPFVPVNLELQQLLSETLQLFRLELAKKKLQGINLLQKEITAFADPNMIRIVVRNLTSNAIKFTEENGKIQLDAWVSANEVTVSVMDTGTGIPMEYVNDIFTLRGITTIGTREEKGTGIGLVLCKEFVEKNGGKIWVESEEGKGTTFYFTLPLAQTTGN